MGFWNNMKSFGGKVLKGARKVANFAGDVVKKVGHTVGNVSRKVAEIADSDFVRAVANTIDMIPLTGGLAGRVRGGISKGAHMGEKIGRGIEGLGDDRGFLKTFGNGGGFDASVDALKGDFNRAKEVYNDIRG